MASHSDKEQELHVDTEPRSEFEPINEKRLLFKIDIFVLSFVCLQYWINYVDRVGFANAYVSGMKEDLGLKGDEFNLINTCFTVGYVLGMIPNNLILLVVQPRIWLSFCTFAWGVLTLSMYKVTNFRQCCAIRFFQAVFESCTFSGTHLILGSWYRENELTIRSAIFTSSGLVGSIFSGFMQVGIHHSLDGHRGLPGWRWLFIVDFLITIPVAIYGFVFFPTTPDHMTTTSNGPRRLFSVQELEFAKRRLPVRDERAKLDWSVVRRVLGRWHWWLFCLLWVLGGENISLASNSTFALWLQSQGYSLAQKNQYPMGIFAVGIAATCGAAVYMDKFRRAQHWHVAVFIGVVMCVVAVMIRAQPSNPAVLFAAQYVGGVCYAAQAIFFSWANVVCQSDLQERAIVLASMNMFSGAVNAWWSLIFYSATMAPRYERGCYALIATAVASGFVAGIIRWFQRRDMQRKSEALCENMNYTAAFSEPKMTSR
ncbi:LANO_0G03752g1_1 [Lachancea nothofagi CBS 11611]|uniref:LANO_0G03752g1_1 n=1 Tax=Lachancea nothofagi CBS 11611 TaxID=1266666 RepID=A0A1G4KFT9_9SACH|nr:LANO_0G03752g1_1 [Lachancea nothofagi CBS 11611]